MTRTVGRAFTKKTGAQNNDQTDFILLPANSKYNTNVNAAGTKTIRARLNDPRTRR